MAGVLVGHHFSSLGADLKPIGDGFIKLIKMVIAPLIFCLVATGRSARWRSWSASTGLASLRTYLWLILASYGATLLFCVLLGVIAWVFARVNLLRFLRYTKVCSRTCWATAWRRSWCRGGRACSTPSR